MTISAVTRSAPLESISSWWFRPVPARRLELCRRITFGYAALWLLVRVSYVWDVANLGRRRFQPVGVLDWLSQPPPRSFVMTTWLVGVVSCGLVSCGRMRRLATATGSAALLLIASLTSSFGQVFHTEHLVVIHLVIVAVATSVDHDPVGDAVSGWSLNLMMASTAVTYVAAGIAKLRYSGLDWVSGAVLRDWVAVDNLRKVLLEDPASTLGGWLAGVAWVWPPIAVFTLIVELCAPVALLQRRVRVVWVGSAWLFHVGIYALMAIAFPYQLCGVAYVAYFPIEQLELRWKKARP